MAEVEVSTTDDRTGIHLVFPVLGQFELTDDFYTLGIWAHERDLALIAHSAATLDVSLLAPA